MDHELTIGPEFDNATRLGLVAAYVNAEQLYPGKHGKAFDPAELGLPPLVTVTGSPDEALQHYAPVFVRWLEGDRIAKGMFVGVRARRTPPPADEVRHA